jgi:hypothetical protein
MKLLRQWKESIRKSQMAEARNNPRLFELLMHIRLWATLTGFALGGIIICWDNSTRSVPIRASFWLLPLMLMAILIIRVHFSSRSILRTVRGQCPSCGYDLRASVDRCPECGASKPIEPTDPPG